jgi:3-hydroxyacyl-[acyl-carrier-protein] dehydratase
MPDPPDLSVEVRVDMPDLSPNRETLDRVKSIIRQDLRLAPDEPIPDDMPLLGGNLDLDSLDVLLLLTSIEKRFQVKISGDSVGTEIFRSVTTLAAYLERHAAFGVDAPVASPPVAATDLLARLPHQPPFRFLTRLETVRTGESGEAVWSIDGTEAFLAGHFPGRPLVPGVLIAEALAQLSGLVGASSSVDPEGHLAHVDVRFREPVVPPSEIRLSSRHIKQMGALRQYQVVASVKESVIAEGTVTLHLTSTPREPPRAFDPPKMPAV